MSGSVNKVILLGNLGADPEIRTMGEGGAKVANLRIATSESWKDKSSGERKEKTEWHSVAIFNEGLINIVEQYLRKGSQVYIEGQLATRKYNDKDGVEKYSTEIVLRGFDATLKMVGGRGGEEGGESAPRSQGGQRSAPSGGGQRRDPAPKSNDGFDDDVPF